MSCEVGEVSSAHSPTFPSLHLCHNSFSNPSVALPTSQLILQPCCFTYVTVHSPTLLSLLLRHRIFTYVTWRAAHVKMFNSLQSAIFKEGVHQKALWLSGVRGNGKVGYPWLRKLVCPYRDPEF